MNSLVTTVYALDEDEKTFGIHSKCHMLFAPEEEEPEKSFTDLLDSFFTTHNTIKENLKQLGNGMPDMEKKERVRIKGFCCLQGQQHGTERGINFPSSSCPYSL